jgi:hypothetical protein
MMSASKVFGPKGLVESRRQRVRGVSRYIGDKIIEDWSACRPVRAMEQSFYQALDAFVGAIHQGYPAELLAGGWVESPVAGL